MSKKSCTTCPNWGEGGRGNLGNTRKKTFFFIRGVSLHHNTKTKKVLFHSVFHQQAAKSSWGARRQDDLGHEGVQEDDEKVKAWTINNQHPFYHQQRMGMERPKHGKGLFHLLPIHWKDHICRWSANPWCERNI